MALYTIAETISGFWGGFMFDGLHLSTQGSSGVMAIVGAIVTVRCGSAAGLCRSVPLLAVDCRQWHVCACAHNSATHLVADVSVLRLHLACGGHPPVSWSAALSVS